MLKPKPSLLSLLIIFAANLSATETTWLNPGTGDWHTPSNWSDGIPTPEQTALINTGTSTLNTTATPVSLRLATDQSSTANLSLSSTANLSATEIDFANEGNATITNNGSITADFLSLAPFGNATLANNGNISATSLDMAFFGRATLINNGSITATNLSGPAWSETLSLLIINNGNITLPAPDTYPSISYTHLTNNGTLSIASSFEITSSLIDLSPNSTFNSDSLRLFESTLNNNSTLSVTDDISLFSTNLTIFSGASLSANTIDSANEGTITNHGLITAAEINIEHDLTNTGTLSTGNFATKYYLPDDPIPTLTNTGNFSANIITTENINLINHAQITSPKILLSYGDDINITNTGNISAPRALFLGADDYTTTGTVTLNNTGNISAPDLFIGTANITTDRTLAIGNITIFPNDALTLNGNVTASKITLTTTEDRWWRYSSATLVLDHNSTLSTTTLSLDSAILALNGNSTLSATGTSTLQYSEIKLNQNATLSANAITTHSLGINLNNNATLSAASFHFGAGTYIVLTLDHIPSTAPVQITGTPPTFTENQNSIGIEIPAILLPTDEPLVIPIIQTLPHTPAITPSLYCEYEDNFTYRLKWTPDGTQLQFIITPPLSFPKPQPPDTTWTDNTTGQWADNTNWSNGTPTTTQNTLINTGNSTLSTNTTTASLAIATTASSNATLAITPDASLITPQLILSYNGNSTLRNDGNISITQAISIARDGTSTIINNSTLSILAEHIIDLAANGTLSIHNNGSFSLATDLDSFLDTIQIAQNGTATISNNGTFSANSYLSIARHPGASATIINNGTFSVSRINLAENGTASFLNNGILSIAGDMDISLGTSGNSTFTNTANATLSTGPYSSISIANAGTANFTNAGNITASSIDIGRNNGTATFENTGDITLASALFFGNDSTVSLTNTGGISARIFYLRGNSSLINEGRLATTADSELANGTLLNNGTLTLTHSFSGTLVDILPPIVQSGGLLNLVNNGNLTFTFKWPESNPGGWNYITNPPYGLPTGRVEFHNTGTLTANSLKLPIGNATLSPSSTITAQNLTFTGTIRPDGNFTRPFSGSLENHGSIFTANLLIQDINTILGTSSNITADNFSANYSQNGMISIFGPTPDRRQLDNNGRLNVSGNLTLLGINFINNGNLTFGNLSAGSSDLTFGTSSEIISSHPDAAFSLSGNSTLLMHGNTSLTTGSLDIATSRGLLIINRLDPNSDVYHTTLETITLNDDAQITASAIDISKGGNSTITLNHRAGMRAETLVVAEINNVFTTQTGNTIADAVIHYTYLPSEARITLNDDSTLIAETASISENGTSTLTLNHDSQIQTTTLISSKLGNSTLILNDNSQIRSANLTLNPTTTLRINLSPARTLTPITVTGTSTLAAPLHIDTSTFPAISRTLRIPLIETPATTPTPPLPAFFHTGTSTHTAALAWNTDSTQLQLILTPTTQPIDLSTLTPDQLLLYALTTTDDPTQHTGTTTHLPTTTINNGTLSITFTPTCDTLTYEVQQSTDLQTWTTLQTLQPSDITGTPITIPATSNTTTTPTQFLRLKISPPSP